MQMSWAPGRGTRLCAHRGDSSRYRENTVAAIESAVRAGADFAEVDVRVTVDGVVVLLHDSSPERLWGLAGDVTQLTWAQLQSVGNTSYRIPRLAEALDVVEGTNTTLLIDMEGPEPAEPAYHVVAATDVAVAWCGHIDGMRTIRRLDPSARIWMPSDCPERLTRQDIAPLAPEAINVPFVALTPAAARRIHEFGYNLAVWTVDDEYCMRRAIQMGIDSVTTNQLEELKHMISEDETNLPAAAGSVDLDDVLDTATELGEWAVEYASSTAPGIVSTKANPADLLTEVDVSIERHVRDITAYRFPEFGFVGEEMGGDATPGVPCWYLDPVDGTTNFANRIPWNSFSLALVVDDTPLVGVVADPWRGDVFQAVRGRGARLNGATLDISQDGADSSLAGRVVFTELAGHLPWPGMVGVMNDLGSRHCTTRIMGSGTMSVVNIAAGRGAGTVIGSFGPVDHLAAALIVKEAGGVVLDTEGNETLFPERGGVLAAEPGTASELFRIWQGALR